MTKVLVLTTNTRRHQRSFMIKLYGDPEQYVYKLANETFADKLPIQMNRIWSTGYGFYGFISLDQKRQRVWYGNNVRQRVQYVRSIYHNSTRRSYYYDYSPEIKQVKQHR